MKKIALLALALAAVAAQAQFLDNNAGSAISGASGTDDGMGIYTLGGNFSFYGASIGNQVNVSNNGAMVMNTTGTVGFSNAAFPVSGTPIVAPFWDDLYSVNAGYYVNGFSNANYDAITWHQQYFPGSGNVDAQAILFRNNATLQGFNFLAGDIAFSYGAISAGSATVGVNSGSGAFTNGPGTVNGSESGVNCPNFANTGQFFLFRYSAGTGQYVGSLQAVPEPASMAALGLGALALLRRRRKA